MYPDADKELERFILDLASAATVVGWALERSSHGRSDREFEIRSGSRIVPFTAKISQTAKGFWGLTEAKAEEIALSQREQLLLLTSATEGYFISSTRFHRLFAKFSRTQEGAVRINENVVRKEVRFADVDEALALLQSRN